MSISEIFTPQAVDAAIAHLMQKGDSKCSDNMYISELSEYWDLNATTILDSINNQTFEPGIIKITDFIKPNGHIRQIANYGAVDRLILRIVAYYLNPIIDRTLCDICYSYRPNRGYIDAVKKAADYIAENQKLAVSIDIAAFFDSINIARMAELVKKLDMDEDIKWLVEKYLNGKTEYDYAYKNIDQGLIQGSSLSPMLSNLYLKELDELILAKYHSVRFADDILIMCESYEVCIEAVAECKNYLRQI